MLAWLSFADSWQSGCKMTVLPTDPALLTVLTAKGEASFSVEIADDNAKRNTGLMFREAMPQDHGMLFVYRAQMPLRFWMKNTPMALDLIFIDQDGQVVSIQHGQPESEAVISSGEPARYVLELTAGTAARNHICPGDLVLHPAIATPTSVSDREQ
ncbi:MAG: DUF192 domain-containing protein [Mesorhizobium sp.]|nr:MAG: DUF192 domain-containing protein [Mesorhizobium sp.]